MVMPKVELYPSDVYARFFQGLANPTRLQIIEALLDGEKNVTQLVSLLGASQSQVSNQLSCLRWCGYVRSHQQGRHTFYRIADPRIRDIINLARQVVGDNAQNLLVCTRLASEDEGG